MDALEAIVLGILEGITEFLPISSTGHLILANRLLGIPSDAFVTSFEIAIQLGAIAAAALLYARRLLVDPVLLRKVVVAFVPTAVVGVLAYPLVKERLLGDVDVVLAALLVGGVAILVLEPWLARRRDPARGLDALTYRHAALIGLCQSLALVPGVSRAAATILGGLVLGYGRRAVVEFSFLLALPTMGAATALDLWKTSGSFSASGWGLVGVGFAAALATAVLAIRFLLRFVETHTFVPFGVYRIALAAVLLAVFSLGAG
jgi:undecaprenyl-diphosphatase